MMLFIGCVIFSFSGATGQNKLVVNPAQKSGFGAGSDLYEVNVFKGGQSFPSYTYISRAGSDNQAALGKQTGKTFNYTVFSFSGPVDIEVTKLGSRASSAVLRPDRLGLGTVGSKTSARGSTVRFRLTKPAKVSVEFDDDAILKDAMLIFADSLESGSDVPQLSAPDVFVVSGDQAPGELPAGKTTVYFPPGVFKIGYWQIPPSVRQVYLAGGAFVRGYFSANRSSAGPIKINGRGILSNDVYPFHYPDEEPKSANSSKWYKAIGITGGKGHLIEGLTLVDGSSFFIMTNCDNTVVKNVNINGFRLNNDGITLAGEYNTVSNCFIRTNDDAISVGKGNLTIRDCVFWQLVDGSIIQLGWYTHNIGGNNVVTNCDVIHAEWTAENTGNLGFITAMMSSSKYSKGDSATAIENFEISNIYFDTKVEKFININPQPHWLKRDTLLHPYSFRNFNVHDIHLKTNTGKKEPLNYIQAFDAAHPLNGFQFGGIYINGQLQQEGVSNNFMNRESSQKIKFR